MEGNLDDLIAAAKAKVGEIIQKPKMTEKLLSKPPFRFIHDTISAITAATGFGDGLYSGAELDSAAITEKQAKLDYLDKIFSLVGICKGRPLEVKSLKVVQGLEPEHTNQFFIDLADCAVDTRLDFAEAVRLCLSGQQAGSVSPPYRRSSQPSAQAESKSAEPSSASAKPQAPSAKEDRRAPIEEMDSKGAPPDPEIVAPERGKSRSGTRGGKPAQATADTGLGGFTAVPPKLDSEIERCDGSEAMTQLLLGELITRPKLTDKLLAKPPFRFLHDIVMEVIRATGFAKGLYSDVESDSANVTEKNQKLVFLEKIIKVVGVHLNTLVEAKPQRIVAGMDPQMTNNFLQLLAVAAKHMPDASPAVRTVLEQFGEESPADLMPQQPVPSRSESKEAAPVPSRSEPSMQFQQQQAFVDDSKVVEERKSRSTPVPQPVAEIKEPVRQDDRREFVPDDKIGQGEEDDGEQKRSARPSTARRRPPKVKDGAKEVENKDIAPAPNAVAKKTNIIVDGAADDDDDEVVPEETRLADDLKSESKAEDVGANNPQSKIVQDIMSRQAEQEAATKQQRTEIVDESKSASNDGGSGGGIRLGKLRKTGLDKKGGAAVTGSTFAEADLEKMRSAIQSLVQQTGPLGTCMDFIQEDISLMTAELHKWEEECRKYELEYEEAKRKTKNTLHPLKVELADLEDQIAEHIAKVSSTKASNAKNDEKIQQILKMLATA